MVAGLVMVGSIITNKAPVSLLSTVPLARLTEEYQVVVAPANSPFKDLRDFAAALKADPAKVPIAGGSAGGTDHITAGLIAKAVGTDARRVAYVANAGGGPAAAMIIGGQVAAGVSGLGEFAENIKAGKMKALGVSSDKRIAGVDIPTFKEQGYDIEYYIWAGMFVPVATPEPVVKALRDGVRKAVSDAEFKDQMAKVNSPVKYLDAPEFAKYWDADARRLAAVVKVVGKVGQ